MAEKVITSLADQVEKAMDGRTQRWLALEAKIPESELSRKMNGISEFTEEEIDRINLVLKSKIKKQTAFYYLRSERAYTEKDGKLSFHLRELNASQELNKEQSGEWVKVSLEKGFTNGVMGASGVYAITIREKNTDREDICYIGSSKSVSVRLYCHKIVSFLAFYLSEDFVVDIYILYTDGFRSLENRLINSICPFLNHKKQTVRGFEIGKKRYIKLYRN